MLILVINAGSSSLKYQLLNAESGHLYAKGLADRIGIDGSNLTHQCENGNRVVSECSLPTHKEAIGKVIAALLDKEHGAISSLSEISAVGHRYVHGGTFSTPVQVNDQILAVLKATTDLAPLHNPPHIIGIEACAAAMPGVPQVAVFDTSFHQTMPPQAYTYAIPYEYYERYNIRRYGFHGTSHKYVAHEAAKMIGRPIKELKIITAHLGNGSSLAAIDGGKVIDTSMGFTPLSGVVMGTRCGDIDPAIIPYLMEKEGLTASGMNDILNKKSGLAAISTVGSDSRDVELASDEGNPRAVLARKMLIYSIKKYVGAYAAALGGLDALVFTAGIGENDPGVWSGVADGLEYMGLKIDPSFTQKIRENTDISAKNSKVKTFVLPTNEELMIARETAGLLRG